MLKIALAALLVSTDATPLCGKCVKKCGKRSYVCAGSYSCRSCQCHCVGEEDELPPPPPKVDLHRRCHSGRFLQPTCKRAKNAEGLGSSLAFWRAGVAYSILLNLTLANDPIVVGHRIGTAAHEWLGLDHLGRASEHDAELPQPLRQPACAAADLRRCVDDDAGADVRCLRERRFAERPDYAVAAGGAELAAAAAGKPLPGSFAETVLRAGPEPNVVWVFDGCPRLTGPRWLADAVEAKLRAAYHGARAEREAGVTFVRNEPRRGYSQSRLRWAVEARLAWAELPFRDLRIAAHFRAGDLFAGAKGVKWLENFPPPLRASLRAGGVEPGKEPTAVPDSLVFDTKSGGRLLPLAYVIAALRSVVAALPEKNSRHVAIRVYAEAERSWLAPLLDAGLPNLQLELTPPFPKKRGGDDEDEEDEEEEDEEDEEEDAPDNRAEAGLPTALSTLDALATADVLILGGGAFSELAASLNDHGVKLAPAAVWGNMHSVAATIEHNATLTYPEGEIDDDTTKQAINTLHRYRLTRAHKANDQKVEL